jgi:hypothetical protein
MATTTAPCTAGADSSSTTNVSNVRTSSGWSACSLKRASSSWAYCEGESSPPAMNFSAASVPSSPRAA